MADPADPVQKEEEEDGKLDLFEDDDEFEEFEDEEWGDDDEANVALQQWEDDWDDDDVNDDFSQQLREELDKASASLAAQTVASTQPAAAVSAGPVPESTMQDQKD